MVLHLLLVTNFSASLHSTFLQRGTEVIVTGCLPLMSGHGQVQFPVLLLEGTVRYRSTGMISMLLIFLLHSQCCPQAAYVLNFWDIAITSSLSGSQLFLICCFFFVHFIKVSISQAFCLHPMFLLTYTFLMPFSFNSNISTLICVTITLNLHSYLNVTYL